MITIVILLWLYSWNYIRKSRDEMWGRTNLAFYSVCWWGQWGAGCLSKIQLNSETMKRKIILHSILVVNLRNRKAYSCLYVGFPYVKCLSAKEMFSWKEVGPQNMIQGVDDAHQPFPSSIECLQISRVRLLWSCLCNGENSFVLYCREYPWIIILTMQGIIH